MSLKTSFEKEGNFLFRFRGQIPVILFLLVIPVIYFTPYQNYSAQEVQLISVIAICITAAGFILRSYVVGSTPKGTSGRNTQGQTAEQLNTDGIYSLVRHPLYLFNYLIWIGIAVYTVNLWFVVLVSLLFWIYYERIMYAEEQFLESKFGEAFRLWSERTPAFFPSLKNYKAAKLHFSIRTVLKREYSGFLATVVSFVLVDFLRNNAITHEWFWKKSYTLLLIAAILVALILRTLKHQTKMLDERDRS